MQAPHTITSALADLEAGRTTSVSLVQACLDRADALDDRLGVFLHRDRDQALAAARASDALRAAGHMPRPLEGIPLGIKDIILTADAPTTGQSATRDPVPTGDAPVVARLRAAGAVMMGKTSTMEFALGFSDPEKPFPTPANPWDTDRWTGGSSSGTGSGIQAGMFLGGLGTDTAGSIRMPAAWCGVSGHKPTYGLVPRTGVLPLAWSLDHVGPLARTAEDCARILAVLAGPDDRDRSVRPAATFDLDEVRLATRGLRIGLARDPMARSTDAVQELVREAADTFAAAGAVVSEVSLPAYDEVNDSVMLGLAAEALDYHHDEVIGRWHDFGRPTRSALLTGALLSGPDYVRTLRVRRHAQRQMARLFADVDLVIGPTATQPAPALDHLDFAEVVGMLQTHYWDGTGHPALSVPMGQVDGLPVGLQIIGRPFEDATVLDAGRRWQQLTSHHEKVAPL
ncbi:amidase [Aeromicrobium wangtongii]|uniref:Amidase n=1 Tax=Aeromicrobium wangtongii TaxID=2969247 RepID=A0ABY5M5Z8_9ACTN|nr:amidase [Aeromicrobium wangtongii]MCD9198717.1 amidase [Aeromicrobium wangtongii]UUP13237.1 amidase [Aeromicrobium wangtongii]